eukprot:128347-Rhodomonas_salina.1
MRCSVWCACVCTDPGCLHLRCPGSLLSCPVPIPNQPSTLAPRPLPCPLPLAPCPSTLDPLTICTRVL